MESSPIGAPLRVLTALVAVVALGWAATPASASPNGVEAPSGVEAATESVRHAVDAAIESLPEPEPLPASPPIDALPPTPAPPRPVAPSPASGAPAVSEGSGGASGPSEHDLIQPAASPTGTHLSTAVADAHGASPPAGAAPVAAQPPAEARGARASSKGAKAVWAIPEPEPSRGPARPEGAAPAATDGDGRSQPAALSDWVGSGPPLPAPFVYLAVFASGLAILVSTRRELGLQTRRRRRP